MLRFYISLFLICCSCSAYANFWDDLTGAVCGAFQDDIEETWGGKTKKFSPNKLCPPYNKEDGRAGTCLMQFDFPVVGVPFYAAHCAERTPDSTYDSPKTRIRGLTCNLSLCWPHTKTLNWDGECVIFPGPYGLPLKRICARIAVPEQPPTKSNPAGIPADPGYTNGLHLNFIGETVPDAVIVDENNNPIEYARPKLCAYSDPGLINLVSDTGIHIDPLDFNPFSQPIHQTTELAPLMLVLKFFLSLSASVSPAELICKLLNVLGSDTVPGLDIITPILKAVGFAMNFNMELFKIAIDQFGSINRSVDSYNFGCVELPQGPMPPPYCSGLNVFIPTPSTKRICSKNDMKPQNSSSSSLKSQNLGCVVSTLPNDIIRNSIRVSLDNMVPLCRNKEDPYTTDKCVELPYQILASAKNTHKISDIVQVCKNPTDTLCMKTAIKNIPSSGAMIVYAQKIGGTKHMAKYYDPNIHDCGSADSRSTGVCQEIWGVNIGQYVDISLSFLGIDPNDPLPIIQNFSLQDATGNSRNFEAKIVKAPTHYKDFNYEQQPEDICVYETGGNETSLVGCEPRIDDGYKILVYSCDNTANLGVTCPPTNSYYTPSFIAALQLIDTDNNNEAIKIATVVTPPSVHGDPLASKLVNLAGIDFTSYVTDTTNQSMPFSGPNSYGSGTLFGARYKNNLLPIDEFGKPTNAVYLDGLEYKNGKYVRGGDNACLSVVGDRYTCKPGINDKNCILTSLDNSDIVSCKKFQEVSKKYFGLKMCSSLDANNCTVGIDSIIGKGTVPIYECNNNTFCYRGPSDMSGELCKVSYETAKRIDPPPSKGELLNNGPDGHYNITYSNPDDPSTQASIPTFNTETQVIRDKTSRERGWCVNTPPPPSCYAIDEPRPDSGNALWPQTPMGKIAAGICPSGFTPISSKKLLRYCLSDIEGKTVFWETLDNGVGCQKFDGIKLSTVNNSFPAIEHKTTYDPNTQTGTISFADDVFLAGTSMVSNGVFGMTFNFDVADTTMLSSMQMTKLIYDDYFILTVNGNVVDSDPVGATSMKFAPLASGVTIDEPNKPSGNTEPLLGTIVINEAAGLGLPDRWNKNTKAGAINLLPYLVNGKNTISIQIASVRGGGVSYIIEYKIK